MLLKGSTSVGGGGGSRFLSGFPDGSLLSFVGFDSGFTCFCKNATYDMLREGFAADTTSSLTSCRSLKTREEFDCG